MEKHIHIYHTNDLHSHFENWPKVVQFLQSERTRLQKVGEEMIVLDIGDHMDRVHPISEATLGKANVRLMNEAHYDYVTIGNNEGITLSQKQLENLYSEANFQVLLANLFEKSMQRPSWLKPYVIHKTSAGMRIAFVGVTVAFQKFYELLGWNIEDPFTILPELVREVKDKGADFVVVLSHLGINDDERMAIEVEGIDVIIGGHTHHVLPSGKIVHNSYLCGAGKFGMNVGQVKITINEHRDVKITPKVYSLEEASHCTQTLQTIKEEMKHANTSLNQKILNITEPLEVEWFKDSSLSKLLAEAIKDWCQADIGMVNAGVLLNSLPKGDVTIGDLHRICPHPINPCKVLLRGDELKEVILHAATERMEKLEMKGFGFRGKVLGKMIYAGVEFQKTILADGLSHIREIFINGELLELDREYVIGTLDMFTFGGLYPEIAHAKEKQYFLPEMLRDVLRWKLVSFL